MDLSVNIEDTLLAFVSSSDANLSGHFCFSAPIFWEGGGELPMIFCQSVSAIGLVNTLIYKW